HAEERGLARPVGAYDADDSGRGHDKGNIVDQQPFAIALAHALQLDHGIAQAVGDRDEDLLGLVALLVLVRVELLEARKPRLGLPSLRFLPHPFELLLDRLLPRRLRRLLLLQALILLLQPRAVVALPGYAAAAVELQYPLRGVVEEIAVVRDRDYGAREPGQE